MIPPANNVQKFTPTLVAQNLVHTELAEIFTRSKVSHGANSVH